MVVDAHFGRPSTSLRQVSKSVTSDFLVRKSFYAGVDDRNWDSKERGQRMYCQWNPMQDLCI